MVQMRLTEKLPTGNYRIISIGVLIIVIVGTAIYLFSRSNTGLAAPNYDIVLPQRTSVEDLGGWQRVSPANSDPVFAYSDTVDSIEISVSQQPLPESFIGNVASEVKRLADSYSATTMIEAGGTQAYIGRSARGPQSVIFAKNNTLLLIKSQNEISQADWITYINNLVDPKSEMTPTF